MRPRLAHVAVLGLFSAGLGLQSLHLGHDLVADEHAECECVAIDRQESAIQLLSSAAAARGMEVSAFAPVVRGLTRGPDVHYGARAPPSV